MKILYLIRGVPGAGKTTLAQSLLASLQDGEQPLTWVEADHFFHLGGSYQFDPALLSRAHQWCQAWAHQGLLEGGIVIVSNTFTRRRELAPYREMALECGYEVCELTVASSLSVEELAQRNAHGVSAETIQNMRDRWEP